jgi:hypothetical protein
VAKQRVTVTLEGDALELVKEIAGPRGVSAFVDDAVFARLQQLSIRALLDEMDEECGPVPEEIMEEVRKEFEATFFGPDAR